MQEIVMPCRSRFADRYRQVSLSLSLLLSMRASWTLTRPLPLFFSLVNFSPSSSAKRRFPTRTSGRDFVLIVMIFVSRLRLIFQLCRMGTCRCKREKLDKLIGLVFVLTRLYENNRALLTSRLYHRHAGKRIAFIFEYP